MDLIIHIGPHKTGATAIQKALHESRDILVANGITPFHVGPGEIRHLSVAYSQHIEQRHPELMAQFGSVENVLENIRKCWDQLAAAVAENRNSSPFALLSSEHFSTLAEPEAFFDRLKSMFGKITVLAYVRDPVPMYLSTLQESIRGKGRAALENGPADYRLRYPRFLNYAVGAVGYNNCVIRNFARANLVGNDVVLDLENTLRRFAPALSLKPATARESLPGAVLAWLIRNEADGGQAQDWAWRHQVARYASFSKDLAVLPRLSSKDFPFADVIVRNNQEVTHWVNSWFLYDQVPLGPDMADTTSSETPASSDQVEAWIMSYLTPEAEQMVEELVKRKLG